MNKRLTKRNEDGTAFYPMCFEKKECIAGCKPDCRGCNVEEQICEKLAEYEDLEEQGKIAPVKKGMWILDYENESLEDESFRCGCCNEEVVLNLGDTPKDVGLNYCPNCGAKMDMEE